MRLGYVAVALMALAIAASLVLAGTPQEVSGGPLLAGVLGLVLAPLVISIGARDRLPRMVVRLGLVTTAAFVAVAIGPRDLAGLTNRAWDVLIGVWGVAMCRSALATGHAQEKHPGQGAH